MSPVGRKTLILITVLIATFLILFSYFFSSSRADRLTSNEEYIKSLQEASRGKKLAGEQPVAVDSLNSQPELQLIEPSQQSWLGSLIDRVFDFFLD